jgi:hypothetical protein
VKQVVSTKTMISVTQLIPKKASFLQKSPYRHFLYDPNFNRWFRNLMRGSTVTAAERLRRIGWMCKHFDTSPQELARMSTRRAEDWLLDMVTLMEDEGARSGYISNVLKAAKSWFRHNRKHIDIDIKLKQETGLYSQEKPPTTPELRKILDEADTRQRVEVSLMAFSTFRDETLGDYLGVDGLKIRDFPEMTIHQDTQTVEFQKIPTVVICRAPISKTKYEYLSFLNAEGSDHLKTYLEERMRPRRKSTKQNGKTVEVTVPGEVLTPDSPIITPKQLNVGSHIRTTNIGDSIKKPIQKAGFKWRPYILRRYGSMKLLHAEEDGLPHSYALFWTGHHGDILMTYTLQKGLDDVTLEKLRAAYKKADEKHLTTLQPKPTSQAQLKIEMRDVMLETLGYTEEERRKLDLGSLTDDEFRDLLQKKAAALLKPKKQKIIPVTSLQDAITEGWEFVTQLPNDQALIRSP